MKKASLLENITYGEHTPAIAVLMDTESVKEIRIVFRKGQHMKEHKAGYPIVVEVFNGSITFGVNGEYHLLNTGSIITLESDIPHDLMAEENSIVRLSLHKADDISRVKKVLK